MENLNQQHQSLELHTLKDLTQARIAIGRTGNSITTKESLAFKLAHANARDAVYATMNPNTFQKEIAKLNLSTINLHSKAEDRLQYLQRPDFGKELNLASTTLLANELMEADILICVADGLSALAIEVNLMEVLQLLIPKLRSANLTIAPICLVQQGRVAIADHIGQLLMPKLSLIFIGERPGLSAADSMGVYITYQPKKGLTDDSRNCISNIRKQGLSPVMATEKIFYLIMEALSRKISGVTLKDL